MRTHLELDSPRLVLVKHVKHIFRKLGRIAEWEELAIDLFELLTESAHTLCLRQGLVSGQQAGSKQQHSPSLFS